ncbi:MAG: flagellin, partial [Planctomycetota bacterium]|jgi:flagellin
MLQTFEGALATVDNLLVRMKQLAEQAATGSYSSAQRTLMNAGSTSFNGITMLDDSATVTIVFGGASDTINITGSNMTKSGLGINSLSIGSTSSATGALGTLDSAINAKDSARAKFGYKMNRLEATVDVLGIQMENLMAAESRISDVDVATEMAAMTRSQVLAQAGVSMLAQANTMPQMALMLLG